MGIPSNLHPWWARRPLVAARAVLWASLVDDPSAHPKIFPTLEKQAQERARLFKIMENLVAWDNSNNQEILAEARREIERSCVGDLPDVLDPFCGGGTIPLEANRLGLPTFGSDLNPVSTLITKALVEIPPKFANYPPVNQTSSDSQLQCETKSETTWSKTQGIVDDIRFYGEWIRKRAQEKIGHLYPQVQLPDEIGGDKATVVAWIWARTIISPDPSWKSHVPLLKSGLLRKKNKGPLVSVKPIVDPNNKTISYRIIEGIVPKGTMTGGGHAECVATGTTIPESYIKQEFLKHRTGLDLIAIAAVKRKRGGRIYLPPDDTVIELERPTNIPSIKLSKNSQYMGPTIYGMNTTDSLFTSRQLIALNTFSNLLPELQSLIENHARLAGLDDDRIHLRDGGTGCTAYAEAIITYLAFAFDKLASFNNSLSVWKPDAECPVSPFGRSDMPMVWDFAEANPLSFSSGSWKVMVDGIIRAFGSKAWPLLSSSSSIEIQQRDAKKRLKEFDQVLVCTDPPYYDNVPYADLSDFFYVWVRHNLSEIWPNECATIATPKGEELVANPERTGSRKRALTHFESGMESVLARITKAQHIDYPATIFYAFKQQEFKDGKTTSTGWETFLQALINAGLLITATWPIRTETRTRLRAQKSSALASSVVLAIRPRSNKAPMETRGGFISALRAELPAAIRMLRQQNIAPVDMAQSAIGPGMRVFSRYSKVVEANGSTMLVGSALNIINEVLGEVLSEEEAELDAYSRFALTWFDQYGYESASFGDADVLARAKVTTVEGVVNAGIVVSQGGQVRLLRREELESDWSPMKDKRRTDWEAVQHLILLSKRSNTEAAALLRQLSEGADRARQLAYLLYAVCEEKQWPKEAIPYNDLITAWPKLSRLSSSTVARQQTIL